MLCAKSILRGWPAKGVLHSIYLVCDSWESSRWLVLMAMSVGIPLIGLISKGIAKYFLYHRYWFWLFQNRAIQSDQGNFKGFICDNLFYDCCKQWLLTRWWRVWIFHEVDRLRRHKYNYGEEYYRAIYSHLLTKMV